MTRMTFGLLMAGLLLGVSAICTQAQEPELQSATDDLEAYRNLVDTLEARDGAYAPGLTEPLLALGTALTKRQRYAEAAGVLRRGVHLARVNDGLYSPTQIPLLEGEIATHMAAGNYAEADKRRGYLLRIQRRVLPSGEEYAAQLMRHAQWQLEAYQRDIEVLPGWRLDSSHDLYNQAAADIVKREGENSPNLAAPLLGLLKTRYLVTDHDRAVERQNIQVYDLSSSRQEQEEKRRRAIQQVQSRNYTQGLRILARLNSLDKPPEADAATPLPPEQLLTLLGDWHLYHGRRNAAFTAYRAALSELAQHADAQMRRARIFGDPTALPDVDGMRTLPAAATHDEGDILLEFGVSSRGRAFGIKRLDTHGQFNSAATRLQRKLKKTVFRPRFEENNPVETIEIVRAFDVE